MPGNTFTSHAQSVKRVTARASIVARALSALRVSSSTARTRSVAKHREAAAACAPLDSTATSPMVVSNAWVASCRRWKMVLASASPCASPAARRPTCASHALWVSTPGAQDRVSARAVTRAISTRKRFHLVLLDARRAAASASTRLRQLRTQMGGARGASVPSLAARAQGRAHASSRKRAMRWVQACCAVRPNKRKRAPRSSSVHRPNFALHLNAVQTATEISRYSTTTRNLTASMSAKCTRTWMAQGPACARAVREARSTGIRTIICCIRNIKS